MKKAILLLLVLTLVLSLAACMSDADRSDNTRDGVLGDGLLGDRADNATTGTTRTAPGANTIAPENHTAQNR